MSRDFEGIGGNYSRQYIENEYSCGRLPNLLKVVICTVCEAALASELLEPLSHSLFLKFLAEGVIQERNGQLTWITDYDGEAICKRCQSEMEKLDKEEGIVLYPPKKYNPF